MPCPTKPHHHPSRQYADMALILGSDPTWGVCDVIAGALGCTPVDIAAPGDLVLDPPPAQRCVRLYVCVRGWIKIGSQTPLAIGFG